MSKIKPLRSELWSKTDFEEICYIVHVRPSYLTLVRWDKRESKYIYIYILLTLRSIVFCLNLSRCRISTTVIHSFSQIDDILVVTDTIIKKSTVYPGFENNCDC